MNTLSGRRTRVLAATTATAGLLLVAACTSSDDGGSGSKTAAGGVELVKAGQLTTCTHLPYPPFQSEIDGKVQGFDVSLIDLVAKDLGVKQEILDTPFENFKTGAFLNSGECDLAAAGMTITEERKKNVDFSDPYFDATQAVLVDKNAGVTSLAEGNTKLRAAINKALSDAKADGTYKKLYEKWIGPYDASAASPSAS